MPRKNDNPEKIREDIMQSCLEVFNEKGLKFTMDDVAVKCHMSKKTMYRMFKDKEDLFLTMVDFVFDRIKESEAGVLADSSLSTAEKIRKLLGVMPESYAGIDFSQLYSLRDKYPKIYRQVEERLETGWEASIALIEQGISEGVVRPVHIPLVKMMLEASLEQFFQRDVLVRNKISYADALKEVVDILVDGILI